MKKNIAVLPGDGVGPEVTSEAVKVLKKIGVKFNHKFEFSEGLIGAIGIDKTENSYPKETHRLCLKSDAILFGAIGDPKYDNDPKTKIRPEQGLLKMRKSLGLYVNLRPIKTFPSLINQSVLKPEVIKRTDFIFVRELIEGIYFGKPSGTRKNGNEAFDTSVYSKKAIMRSAKIAFDLALNRNRKITLVDKANVLETSRLWRNTVQQMAPNYPEVKVNFMFVDSAAMQIIKNPKQFDVILIENMFGDILSDEASVITGSLGMLPSAAIGEKVSLYEPIHGSYPKAAGKNIANPIGSILSAAMMLDYSFGLKKESEVIYQAVEKALEQGFETKDIINKNPISTSELGNAIISFI